MIKRLICALVISMAALSGCAGSGFEKKTTFCPDSMEIGYERSRYKSEPDAWHGFGVALTWEFK